MEGLRAGRSSERSLVLDTTASSILRFELFVDGLDFLAKRERDRLTLAGGEILDNIVKHASPDPAYGIRARAARRGSRPLLAFYFRGTGFAAFAAARVDSEPFFDPATRRWRGIGLVMCRNLAKKLSFRPGELVDRIFLEFDAID